MAGDERSEQERWESYFYPETYDPVLGVGVLRNVPVYRDPDVLR